MSKRTLTAVLVTASFALGANTLAGHHEKAEGHKGADDAMAMDDQAMMQAMAAAATPGDPHAVLADGVGTYKADMQFWMGPGTDPMPSTMTVERAMDLGGRVLVERWKGLAMGQPFEGVGRTGYDNVTKRYWSTWTDNFSTGVLIMYGTYDKDTGGLSFEGTSVHPASGAEYKMRSSGSGAGTAVETMAMFEDHGQGEYKSMQVTLTRQ